VVCLAKPFFCTYSSRSPDQCRIYDPTPPKRLSLQPGRLPPKTDPPLRIPNDLPKVTSPYEQEKICVHANILFSHVSRFVPRHFRISDQEEIAPMSPPSQCRSQTSLLHMALSYLITSRNNMSKPTSRITRQIHYSASTRQLNMSLLSEHQTKQKRNGN
jgi:hypothetical protein